MPAKKAAKKKIAKKAAGKVAKKSAAKPARKAAKKVAKKAAPKKAAKTRPVKAPVEKKIVAPQVPEPMMIKPEPQIVPTPSPAPAEPKELIECEHCQGIGKCSAGSPFDRGHHQGLFREDILTSCHECLLAAGKALNSKKLVACRFCGGTGKVEKPA